MNSIMHIMMLVFVLMLRYCHHDDTHFATDNKFPTDGVAVFAACVDLYSDPPMVTLRIANDEKYPIEISHFSELLPLAGSIKIVSRSGSYDPFEEDPWWNISPPVPDLDTITVQPKDSVIVECGLLGLKRNRTLTPQKISNKTLNIEINGTIKYRLIGGGGEVERVVNTRSVARTRCE